MRARVAGLETPSACIAGATDIVIDVVSRGVRMCRGTVVMVRMIVPVVGVDVQHPQRARGRQREDHRQAANHPASV
jgi:hypothetical protein